MTTKKSEFFFRIALLMAFASPLVLGQTSHAKKIFYNALLSQYSVGDLPNKCNTCHKNGVPLNPFGKDFDAEVWGQGSLDDQENWLKLAVLDSDGDGISNDEELKMGRHPGKVEAPVVDTPLVDEP